MEGYLLYRNELTDRLRTIDEVTIYGAGTMGKAVKTCLEGVPYQIRIKSFLVESMKDNPEVIDDIPVIDIGHADKYKHSLVLVALHERHMGRALGRLQEEGFSDVVPVSFDSDVWSDIRGNWFWYRQSAAEVPYTGLEEGWGNRLQFFNGKKGKCLRASAGEAENCIHIYVANSAADRPLAEDADIRDFEVPIQVGAALTDKVIAPLQDNTGFHISEKNRKYCELTALYWIWKNGRSRYTGLCHYRRRFILDEDTVSGLVNSDIDVVLTVPILNFPSVRQQYCADHVRQDWDIMLEAVRLMWPEYMETAEKIQSGIYYFAYNMFIARKEILDRFCEWLFPVLFYCEEKIGDKEDSYQNRYIGFLAERLLTIFFVHNMGKYKIAIARKHFIGDGGEVC